MSNMYYEREPQSASREVACVFSYHGNRLTFQTDAGVFSKGELDQGTRLLLDALPELTGEVLDLGCGWGAIGIAVKKAFPQTDVTMVGTPNPSTIQELLANAEKFFDDYIPLFAVAIDRTFGEMNKQ